MNAVEAAMLARVQAVRPRGVRSMGNIVRLQTEVGNPPIPGVPKVRFRAFARALDLWLDDLAELVLQR
jgi:hypothetical protein